MRAELLAQSANTFLCCPPPSLQVHEVLRAELQAQSAKALAEASEKYSELQVRGAKGHWGRGLQSAGEGGAKGQGQLDR